MSLLQLEEVQGQIQSDLSDTVIQAMINREEAEVNRRFGQVITARTEVYDHVLSDTVWVAQPVDSTKAIVVEQSNDNFVNTDTLTTTDYRVFANEGRFERLSSSLSLETDVPRTTVRFKRDVRITYTPEDDTQERKSVVLELVRLALSRQAMLKESIGQGDYSFTAPESWEQLREELIRRLERFPAVGGL